MTRKTNEAFAALAAAQHGAVTRRQAAVAGLTRYRISALIGDGLVDEPAPGVLRVRAAVPTWHQRLSVAVLAAGGAVASHRSAARLHGLDGLRDQLVVEVSVPRTRRHRLAGVVTQHVTPLDPADMTVVDGIPCTTLSRTLADLGAVVRPFSVQQALTDARRRRIDLDDLRSVAERLHRPGQAGTGVLLRLLDAIPHEGRVPESWMEELLAACVADPRLPPVIPQYEIRDANGMLVARTDLGIPAVQLGLEGHSRQFHFGPLQEPLDEQRDLRVAACGWELLYLGWYAAHRPEQVARRVRDVVRARRRDVAA